MMNAVATPADAAVDWLHRRGTINERQLGAVRRLQNRWDRHKDRYEADMAALGPGLGDIVWRVLIRGDGLREAENALGWPARAGKLVLVIALNRLADHYASAGEAETATDSEAGVAEGEHATAAGGIAQVQPLEPKD